MLAMGCGVSKAVPNASPEMGFKVVYPVEPTTPVSEDV